MKNGGSNTVMKAITLILTLCLAGMGSTTLAEYDLYPAWWSARDVITTHTNLFINDRAPVNQGQMKWMALQAYEAFQEQLPGAANSNIQQRVDGFTDQDNYLPVNLGQLKHVAAPCYDRLAEYGLAGSYPWEGDQDLANDYAIATIGQVKNFFSFDLPITTNFYYVATDGSDSNPGTIDEPFQTIQHAVNQVIPGDTVLIRGGTYREQVTLTVSGTPELPITIMGYGDEYPVIKGSEIVTNWVHYKDDIWMVTNWPADPQQVFQNGRPLQQIGYPSKTFEDNPSWYPVTGLTLDDMMEGSFFFEKDSNRLYVWLNGNKAPLPGGLEISTRAQIFLADRSYIKIHAINFAHNSRPWNSAVILGSESTITKCSITWCSFIGLNIKSNSMVINCDISNNGNSGISANIATNFLIAGCSINSNNYRNFNSWWHAGGLKLIPYSSGTVESCDIGFNNGCGVWFDGDDTGDPIIIRNNYVHDNNKVGIFVEISRNADIYNNLVVDNYIGISVAESDTVRVFNNTIIGSFGYAAIQSRTGYSRISGDYPFHSNQYYNNLVYNNTSTYDIMLPTPNDYIWGNTSDFNCVFRSDGTARFSGYGLSGADLSDWQSASGQDLHSLEADPRLLNPFIGQYTPSSISPLINHGTNLTWFYNQDTDFAGIPRISMGGVDIGCYEFREMDYLMRPELIITSTEGALPYDQTTLTGLINANLTGDMEAVIISSQSTNYVPIIPIDTYTWELDISDLPIGEETTITIYGTDNQGSLAQQTITLTRGDVGTGTPALDIHESSPLMIANGTVILSGTCNEHTAESLWWSNLYHNTTLAGGTFTATTGNWDLQLADLHDGRNTLTIYGSNDWGVITSYSILIDYGGTANHYVDANSATPVYPYATPETAAATIQAAIDAATAGDTVWVDDGIYDSGISETEQGHTRVLLEKGIRLQSIRGPESAIIRGSLTYPWPEYARCLQINHPAAEVVGFTLEEGYANGWTYGGGALIQDIGIMSNCIIQNCVSPYLGGGICTWRSGGLITDCIIQNNYAKSSGGGIKIQWGSGLTLENCIISDNVSAGSGGGLSIDNCRRVWNCLVTDNYAGKFGGGIVLGNNSEAYNCTIENNTSLKGGGVSINASLGIACIYNSIFMGNYPDNFTTEQMHPDKVYRVEYCHSTILPTNLTSTMGSMTNTPIYLYPYSGDYRLSSNSPCLDMGATYDWMMDSMALNNTNRILFGQPDRGCYEYDGAIDLFEPLVEIFSSTEWIPYDKSAYTAYGGRNINTTIMDASHTTNGITNNLIVNLSAHYDWSIDPVELTPEVTNIFTITGWNTASNISEQSFFVIRGGIGTGAPVIAITNSPASMLTNTVFVISGTNNMHTISPGSWTLSDTIGPNGSGLISFSDSSWELSFTNLNADTYSLEVGATNLWGEHAMDTIEFEVQ